MSSPKRSKTHSSQRGMISFVIFIALLLLIQSCQNLSIRTLREPFERRLNISRPPVYPQWFWWMPTSDTALFAVGYAQTYFHQDKSVEQAILNGVENLAKSISVRIKGERGFAESASGPEFAGEDFKEEIPENVLGYVKENYKVVAVETVGEVTLVLLCVGEAPPIDLAQIQPRPDCPNWVSELPKEPGVLYAVGQSNPQFHMENAWQLVEYNARIALALSLSGQIHSLSKKLDGTLDTIAVVKTDVTLNRVQVVERWLDPKNNIPYALVRAVTTQEKLPFD